MPKYKCLYCGYSGNKLIFQFTDYTYCVATNDEEPEFIDSTPRWVEDMLIVGDAEIGEPVGCPKCHAWGVGNFSYEEEAS